MKKIALLPALRGGGVVVFALFLASLWGTPALAAEYGGIGGRPAHPDASNSRTESIFVFSLDPGSSASNTVKIYNNSTARKTIAVYPVDSQISSGGAFACAQQADEKRAVGSWMKLEKEAVTLDPAESEEVSFALTVPQGTAAGEHNGCIAIQEVGQTPQSAGNGIALSFRSAIRVAVTVKGDIKKSIAFTRLQSTAQGDKRHINTALKNNGNVSLDTLIDVQLKTIFGTAVEKTGGEFPVLSSGESEFNFDINEPFWGGVYLLRATAHYNADLTADLGTGDKKSVVDKNDIVVIAPKPMAAFIELVVLIAFIGGVAAWLRRLRIKRQWQRDGTQYVVQDGDTIQKLAESYGLPWKYIARINRLKAPYHLEPGQELKLLAKSDKKPAAKTKRKHE